MWFPVSTIAALCVLLDFTETAPAENELELLFRDRSQSDWEEAWHKEKYTRCREKLIRHLYWACEKDIYRLTKRSSEDSTALSNNFNENDNDMDQADFPWLTARKAKRLLRFRRGTTRGSGSITAECCKSSGCTWEEYAEYCPTNKRRYTTYV